MSRVLCRLQQSFSVIDPKSKGGSLRVILRSFSLSGASLGLVERQPESTVPSAVWLCSSGYRTSGWLASPELLSEGSVKGPGGAGPVNPGTTCHCRQAGRTLAGQQTGASLSYFRKEIL